MWYKFVQGINSLSVVRTDGKVPKMPDRITSGEGRGGMRGRSPLLYPLGREIVIK
ncbi:hypothetical protein [Candidatus Tisiphia endosymbiont of Nemotelus uliginosus]|uniref:hypothetical protein n=1 Tax=Candidatus Tisiphia endosymbiont of Nemotelus uliginosus TaxID=3077926 RepID=UPI0035C8F774